MELFYKNKDVIVSNDFYDSELLVISFSPLVDEAQVPTKDSGFGKVFFNNRKISCVYVIPVWNHWYQYEYIRDAIDIIGVFSKNFKKVVIYGVSMGGYAALKYANFFESSGVISISPQATIAGVQSEFDKRFSRFWSKIEFKSDTWSVASNRRTSITVLYDKYHYEDNGHAGIISRNIKHAKMVGLPFSGHEVFAVLNEAGILSDFIFALINENASQVKLLRMYRKNRHKSAVTWMYAAKNSLIRGRGDFAKRLFRKSVEVIEWRKNLGLNIDLPKARMTLMAYIEYCFKVGDFEAFLDAFSRFSDNKIIEIDLSLKYLESCVLRNDKVGFLAALNAYKAEGREAVGTLKNITVAAIEKNLVSEGELA